MERSCSHRGRVRGRGGRSANIKFCGNDPVSINQAIGVRGAQSSAGQGLHEAEKVEV